MFNGAVISSERSLAGLRIALFSGNYNCTRDGANRALNRLVGHLLGQGAVVRVYSPTAPSPAFEPMGTLVSVPSFPIPGRPEFRAATGLPGRIRRDIRHFRPNLFHLSAPDWLGTSALSFAKENGIPTIASMHTRFETYLEYYGLRLLKSWAWRHQATFYKNCDLVLAPNEGSREHLAKMGVKLERLRTWARGVDYEQFSPARRSLQWRRDLGFADTIPVVLFFGRIVREKGIATFVSAVREVRRREHNIGVLVVGAGPAQHDMSSALRDGVFVGHLDGEDLGRAVASAEILLNPSLTEAFGNVNLEAMASGLAIVSADVPSARNLIRHGETGLLSNPDEVSLATSIGPLVRNPAFRARLGLAARLESIKYDWSVVLDRVVGHYRELLSCSPLTGSHSPKLWVPGKPSDGPEAPG